MDKYQTLRETPLLQAAFAAAQPLDIAVQKKTARPKVKAELGGAEALIHITRGDNTWPYIAEVRPRLHPATLGIALQQLQKLRAIHAAGAANGPGQHDVKPMLITEYVTPALADQLRAQSVAFLDTAGNAYIENGDVLIWVKGQKRPAKANAPAAAVGRAFQPTGLQVVFTLLCNPGAVNLPYRELARMAGAAHGTVGWVIPDLQQQGFVQDLDGQRGTRRLYRREAPAVPPGGAGRAVGRRLCAHAQAAHAAGPLLRENAGRLANLAAGRAWRPVGRRAGGRPAERPPSARRIDGLRRQATCPLGRAPEVDEDARARAHGGGGGAAAVLGLYGRACTPEHRAAIAGLCGPAGHRRCPLHRDCQDDP